MQARHLRPEAQVELLRRQYLQLVDPRQLSLPGGGAIKAPEIQARIYRTMFQDGCVGFPPPPRYRLRVLKRIVAAIEQALSDPDEDELSDDLAASLAELMAEPTVEPATLAQQRHYVTYTLPGALEQESDDQPAGLAPGSFSSPPTGTVTLLESQDVLASQGTTGRRTWEAALWLGAFLAGSAKGRSLIAGKTILELGAGTGFLAVLCARHLRARFVLATDGSGDVVDGLAPNLFLNGLDHGDAAIVDTAVLHWGHALIDDMLDGTSPHRRFDLVLGSDLIYDNASVRPLVATLRQMLTRDPGTLALISATVRNEALLQLFEQVCVEQCLAMWRLAVPPDDPNQQLGLFHRISMPIRIYLIQPK